MDQIKIFFPLPSVFHRNISSRCCSSFLNRKLVFSKIRQEIWGSGEGHLVNQEASRYPSRKLNRTALRPQDKHSVSSAKPPHWALRKCDQRHLVICFQGHIHHLCSSLLVLYDLFQGHPISVSSEGLSVLLPAAMHVRRVPHSFSMLNQIPDMSSDIFLYVFLKVQCPCF